MADANMAIPKIESSHAILRLSDKYVLQLRDDKPDIAAQGQWSLFGGMIDAGETPLEAIKRELFEELSIRPNEFKFLWYTDYYYEGAKGIVRSWFFTSKIDDVWDAHQLKEGEAVDTFSFNDMAKLDIPEIVRQTLDRYNSEETKLRDGADNEK